MKNKALFYIFKSTFMLAFLTVTVSAAVVLAGCSQSSSEPAPEQKVISFDSQPVITASETMRDNSSDSTADVSSDTATDDSSDSTANDSSDTAADASKTEDAAATVRLNVTYEDGNPDIIEALDIDGVEDHPDETGSIITGYDKSGKLIYKRSDTSVTDAQGKMDVEITYEFYSLDHDFDLRVEPLYPENGGGIQTVKGSVVTDGTSSDFTFETVGRRGQTGIWYAGICSCRNGVLGDYDGI
jgi:hypothetical protein